MLKLLTQKHTWIALVAMIAATILLVGPLSASADNQAATSSNVKPSDSSFVDGNDQTITGAHTFTIKAKGTVDVANFSIFKASDLESAESSKALALLFTRTPAMEKDGFSYYSVNWSSQTVSNGNYILFAKVDCYGCGNNGASVSALADNNLAHLRFTVDNPALEPLVVKPETSPECSNLEDARSLAKTISEKHRTQLEKIDETMQLADEIYESNSLKITNYTSITKERDLAHDVAKIHLTKLEASAMFICSNQLDDAITDYATESKQITTELDAYRDSARTVLQTISEKL